MSGPSPSGASADGVTAEEEFLYLLTEGSDRLRAGRIDEAQAHFKKALEIEPGHEQALNLLGLSHFRLGQLEDAERIFEGLIHENPVEPSLRLNLAMVFLKKGDLVAARHSLEQVLDLNPHHPRAVSYMGLVLERLGDLAGAAEWLERAGETDRAAELRAAAEEATAADDDGEAVPAPPEAFSEPPSTQQLMPEIEAASPPAPQLASAPLVDDPALGEELPEPPDETSFEGLMGADPDIPIPDAPSVDEPEPAPEPLPPAATTGTATAGTATSVGTEAAALTAARVESLRRPQPPPSADEAESARSASLGFTLDAPPGGPAREASTPAPLDLEPPPAATPAPVSVPDAPSVEVAPPPTDRPARFTLQELGAREPRPQGTRALTTEQDLLALPIRDILYLRTDRMVALTGELEVEPINRRYRGRRTDSLFGGNETPMSAAMGQGLALLDPGDLEVTALELAGEDLYLVERYLVAFSEGLVWENGRLPSDDGDDLDIVHLRGSGDLTLATDRPLVCLEVQGDRPVTLHAARLVGWSGQIVPFRGPFPGLPESARRPPIVRFEGSGLVLGA